MARNALVLRHVPHEGLAGFAEPLEAADYAISYHDPGDGPLGEEALAADLLIVLGGPMGVYEQDLHPWIGGELEAIRRRVAAERPLLGTCLGSQLVAAALGARVFPGPEKEVGFAPVALSPAGAGSPLRHLADVPILHWHGDTFDLPENVELLASTSRYPHQAFRRDNWLLALQCHPEMGTAADFDAWLDDADAYLAEAGTTAEHVRRDYAALGPAAAQAGRAMFADWLAGLE